MIGIGIGIGIGFGSKKKNPYGPEKVTNGTFDTNLNGWTHHPTFQWDTAEWSAGKLHLVSNGVNEGGGIMCFYQSLTLTAGKTYKIEYSATRASGTYCIVSIENAVGDTNLGYNKVLNGNFIEDTTFICGASATFIIDLWASCTYASDYTLDNFSIKEVL
jgi:hypothetical protein